MLGWTFVRRTLILSAMVSPDAPRPARLPRAFLRYVALTVLALGAVFLSSAGQVRAEGPYAFHGVGEWADTAYIQTFWQDSNHPRHQRVVVEDWERDQHRVWARVRLSNGSLRSVFTSSDGTRAPAIGWAPRRTWIVRFQVCEEFAKPLCGPIKNVR